MLRSVDILLQQQLVFVRMFGLTINAAKSFIFFSGVREDTKHAMLLHIGFAEGSFPFKYLGVPLSPHRLESCIHKHRGYPRNIIDI